MQSTHARNKIDRPANSSSDRPAKSLKRWLISAVALGLGLLIHLGGESASTAREAHPQGPRLVDVAAVRAAPEHRVIRFTGVVRAEQRAQLGFTMSGRVTRRPAQVGQRVSRGAVLAQLDRAPLRLARDAARAQLADVSARHAQLERDFERTTRLVAQKAAVNEALEKVRAARDATTATLEGLQAQLAEAQRRLKEATLTAPFDGTVLQVLMEPGETTVAGRPVVVLSAERRLEVEVQVPESVRAGLESGAKVQVSLPLAGLDNLSGVILRLGRAAFGPGELFPVIISLDPATGVVPGYTAEVALPLRQDGGLLVPVPSVADPGGQSPFVYRVKDGLAERVQVTVSALYQHGVLVQAALTPGEEVVVRGHASLLSGEAVQVRR